MIKVGIFGDQSTNPELIRQLKSFPEVVVQGIYISGDTTLPEGFTRMASPEGLMDVSDAMLFIGNKSISFDMIRMILRKSKHVYLHTIPNLNVKEIKELIDLEKEAGILTFIFNPFNYLPWIDSFRKKNDKPVLVNIRTCFETNQIKPLQEILLLVIALNMIVKSNFKKIDVFGLSEPDNLLVINLRIEYENGSVINMTISEEKAPGYCEIFEQTGNNKYEFNSPTQDKLPHLQKEKIAISQFLNLIQDQNIRTNTFDNFLTGLQIINEIREQLRFNEIIF